MLVRRTGTCTETQSAPAVRSAGHPTRRRGKTEEAPLATPWDKLHQEAAARFGIQRFRPGQRTVLDAVFHGCNVLALMPTGSGKSLCYQLPALFLPKTVVVVSPLLALMLDQEEKAEQAEIAVERVDSTLSAAEQAQAIERVGRGIPSLLYVTPERLENREFLEQLRQGGVSLLAIDEAHCISQWGHDFRPAYMNLRYAREQLGNPPVLAVTATATDEVAADILKQLGAEDALRVDTGVERPNLAFSVHPTVNTGAKQQRLLELLREQFIAERHRVPRVSSLRREPAGGDKAAPPALSTCGIVYTASVRTALELQLYLTEHLGEAVSVACYHGRLPARERSAVQQAFMRGEHQVLIATKAFGMGIDKANIRFVYHYEFPDSLESYYQEAGRAGRDGLPASAVLLYRLEDRRIQAFFQVGRYPRLEELCAVFSALDEKMPASAAAVAERSGIASRRVQGILPLLRQAALARRTARGYTRATEAVSDAALEDLLAGFTERAAGDKRRLDEMMHYAESPQCRKQLLRAYFNEPEGEPCGACDNCLDPDHHEAALPEPGRQEQVVERITASGAVIATTAPETLPQIDPGPAYQKGERVRHRKFGEGRVLEVEGDNLMVRFQEHGVKTVRTTYVQRSEG